MLDKFLIVGAGGSGGRTVRLLRAELRRRLFAAGYVGDLPAGWRFLHVDVPEKPDVNDVGPDDTLPYVGLSRSGVAYRDLDAMVMRGPADVREHVAAWRPDPARAPDDPTIGAGQIRAAGRIIAASGMPQLAAGLRSAWNDIGNADVNDLRIVSETLGSTVPSTGRTWIIVISSLSGGAGAGMYLDVCDVLRQIAGVPDRAILGILYAADVFDGIKGQARLGIMPNGLAAFSELLADYWDSRAPGRGEFSLLSSAGVNVMGQPGRRGVTHPFLISRTNGDQGITLQDQFDAFRLASAALASVMTESSVQESVQAAVFANWISRGSRPDESGLTSGQRQPLSAIGYAGFGLGRDRFAAYATQRMTGELAQRLIDGHKDGAEPNAQEPEILDKLVRDNLDLFLQRCGLQERGTEHTQILDTLRGGDEKPVWRQLLDREIEMLLNTVRAGVRELDRDRLQANLVSTSTTRRTAFEVELKAEREERARQWVTDVQPRIIEQTVTDLTRLGIQGMVAMLDATYKYLINEVAPELKKESARWENPPGVAGTASPAEAVKQALITAKGRLNSDSQLVSDAAKASVRRWYHRGEASLTALAGELVVDLAERFIAPLRKSLSTARVQLYDDFVGSAAQVSPLRQWAAGSVSTELMPAAHELLLESAENWPSCYESLVRSTIGSAYAEESIRSAWRQVLDQAKPVVVDHRWSPASRVLSSDRDSADLRVTIDLAPSLLESASRAWLRNPEGSFRPYFELGLDEWLNSGGEGDSSADRQRRFVSTFSRALDIAVPLIDIDPVRWLSVHTNMPTSAPLTEWMITPLPIMPQTDVGVRITRALRERGMEAPAIARILGSQANPPSYGIVTMLDGPVSPLVVGSMATPIAADAGARVTQSDYWSARRARPLMNAIPAPPQFRAALVRGWFVAVGLGCVNLTEPKQPKIWIDGHWHEFNHLFRPLPTKSGYVLGALLEALPLALVNAVATDVEAFAPYRRLAEYGMVYDGERYDPATDGLPTVLDDWLRDGVWPAGPTFARIKLGTGNDCEARTSAMLAYLTDLHAAYEQERVRGPEAADQGVHTKRRRELTPAILDSLGELFGDLHEWNADSETGPDA